LQAGQGSVGISDDATPAVVRRVAEKGCPT